MSNTRKLMNFDLRQLQLAGKMLATVGTERDCTEILEDGVAVELNRETGIVFVIDTNFQVARLDGNLLRDWFRCPCGCEGFEYAMQGRECCKKHVEQAFAVGAGRAAKGRAAG